MQGSGPRGPGSNAPKFLQVQSRQTAPTSTRRHGHDISHTLSVAVHLRLAARLDTWLDSSLLCLSTPHMLWTRGENKLQGAWLNPSERFSHTDIKNKSHTSKTAVFVSKPWSGQEEGGGSERICSSLIRTFSSAENDHTQFEVHLN